MSAVSATAIAGAFVLYALVDLPGGTANRGQAEPNARGHLEWHRLPVVLHRYARFEQRDEIEVVYRSFELDPSIPGGQATPILDMLAAKYGMGPAQAQQPEARVAAMAAAEGLEFTADRAVGNTFDAHRLVHLGREHGRQERLLQRLYRAYFGKGRPVFDHEALTGLAAEEGLDPDIARRVLKDGSYGEAVHADEDQAARLGINGVPFCVIDGKYGVSGPRRMRRSRRRSGTPGHRPAVSRERRAVSPDDPQGSPGGWSPLFMPISPARKPFRGATTAGADRLRPSALHAIVGP
jgi:predicted DsbA family dithiol-disulfide isomerase